MTFTEQQIEQLQAPLNPALVKRKPVQGSPAYIPGFVAIEAANRIFGFDGWGYTLDQMEREDTPSGVMYSAWVTVTVTGCHPKKDIGTELASNTRDGNPPSGQALETAKKGAVTDGIKRALRSFGDSFGSVLYDKDADINREWAQWLRIQAGEEEPPPTPTAQSKPRAPLAVVPASVDVEALRTEVLQRLEADPDAASKLPKAPDAMNAEELVKTHSWLARRQRASS